MIGILGFKGAGKDTFADCMAVYGFEKFSFAKTMKDVVAAMFSWDRNLLEGHSEESRYWRDQVDEFWSRELEIPNFTPRLAMTMLGSDVIRKYFNDNIWLISLKKQIEGKDNVIIVDCRFPHEIKLLESMNSIFVRVDREIEKPRFWEVTSQSNDVDAYMEKFYPGVHESEWKWNCKRPDFIVPNLGSKEDIVKEAARVYEQLKTYRR